MRYALRFNHLLACCAVFAFLWVLARACVQSITIDEADTYLAYVAPPAPTHWSGSANNQVLNSLLMRLFTSIFGLSHLSVRAPALAGAAIYIFAAYYLVLSLARRPAVEWPLFLCLVYNPFIMDHLVAARGYSLALAFWMSIVALTARAPGLDRTCILASLGAALSFAANFSFAFVDMAAMLLVLFRARRAGLRPRRALLACTVPGVLLASFLTGSILATWPRGQFVFGATSLRETFASVVEASLFEVNPYLVNPPLHRVLEHSAFLLFPLLAAACLWRILGLVRSGSLFRDRGGRWAAALAAVAGVTIGAHWLLFRAAHILLPKERTAIYVIPLFFLIAGALAAIPGGRLSARFLTCILSVTATYFVLCLRLDYFKEWKYDADVKETYGVLSYYNHNYGMVDIMTNWRYAAALNFYRAQSGRETIPPLQTTLPPYPGDRQAYVMYYPADEQFIREHGLKIVYHGSMSDAVVAIRPELESPQQASPARSRPLPLQPAPGA